MDEDIKRYREARNQALRALDVAFVRQQFPDVDDETLLLTLHKARYDCVDIEPALRLESGEWLRKRGSYRMTGGPILPPGELPK